MLRTCLPTLCFLSTLLYLGACSYNPLSSNNHLTGSPGAVALGGAAGLGSAAALGATETLPLSAATIAGASVGYYTSTLRFASAGIYHAGGQVYTLGDYITIEIPSDHLFDSNSAELLPDAMPVLKSAAQVLKRSQCQNILISGNTSGFGTTKFERRISEERARVVAGILWDQGINNFTINGTDLRKLTYVGYGNYFPIANNVTNKGIRTNSRIQITGYPTKDQLLVDEKSLAFNNMGAFNEPHLTESNTPNLDTAFNNGDFLPERASTQGRDIAGTLDESKLKNPVIAAHNPKHTDFYVEQGNRYNNVEKMFQSSETHPSSPNQAPPSGGFKHEFN